MISTRPEEHSIPWNFHFISVVSLNIIELGWFEEIVVLMIYSFSSNCFAKTIVKVLSAFLLPK